MANYSWIFMEGLYLHNLIFMALFTDSSAITIYILLGWGKTDKIFTVKASIRPTVYGHFYRGFSAEYSSSSIITLITSMNSSDFIGMNLKQFKHYVHVTWWVVVSLFTEFNRWLHLWLAECFWWWTIGLPLLFVLLWIVMRALFEDIICWTTNKNEYIFWLIRGPITVSILVSWLVSKSADLSSNSITIKGNLSSRMVDHFSALFWLYL